MLILLPMVVAAIGRPVRTLTRTMTELAAGNMAAAIGAQDHRDELGDMARAVLVFKEHMVREQQIAAEQEAERDQSEAEKRAALVGMAQTIETATNSALRQIGDRTTAMAATADAHERVRHPHGRLGQGCGGRGHPGTGHRPDSRGRRGTACRIDPRDRQPGRAARPRWWAAR